MGGITVQTESLLAQNWARWFPEETREDEQLWDLRTPRNLSLITLHTQELRSQILLLLLVRPSLVLNSKLVSRGRLQRFSFLVMTQWDPCTTIIKISHSFSLESVSRSHQRTLFRHSALGDAIFVHCVRRSLRIDPRRISQIGFYRIVCIFLGIELPSEWPHMTLTRASRATTGIPSFFSSICFWCMFIRLSIEGPFLLYT